MAEKIYLYCSDQGKKNDIALLAKTMNIGFQEMRPTDLSRKVGAIVGMTKQDTKDASVPMFYNMPEVMLFSGMDQKRLDLILHMWRMKGIAPVELKAVVTAYNCSWTLYKLIEELRRERATIG